jgi:hypothetical protein
MPDDAGVARKPWRRLQISPQGSRIYTLLSETGAGEGIRTLDPNLGKVVLYP